MGAAGLHSHLLFGSDLKLGLWTQVQAKALSTLLSTPMRWTLPQASIVYERAVWSSLFLAMQPVSSLHLNLNFAARQDKNYTSSSQPG